MQQRDDDQHHEMSAFDAGAGKRLSLQFLQSVLEEGERYVNCVLL
jgi:hypothetical protein